MKDNHYIPISGKDSMATALVQTTLKPDLNYQFFFNDTGAELPETLKWIDKVEHKTDWNIQRISSNLYEIIKKNGNFLPSPKARYCTQAAKIKPTLEYLKSEQGKTNYVYYGLRADEQRKGFVPFGGTKIIPKYPLQEVGLDLNGVWALLKGHDLLPPTFRGERLVERVTKKAQGGETLLSEIEELYLFSGRSRANCSFCFFQRQYEFLWLLETHPDLFERASGLEKEDYTWRQGYSLKDLKENKRWQQDIFDRRVNTILTYINAKRQLSIPGLETENELSFYSCGLICGK